MTFDNRVPVKAFAAMFVLVAVSGTAFAGNGSVADIARNGAAAAVETVDTATAGTKEAGGRVAAEATRAAGKDTGKKDSGRKDSAGADAGGQAKTAGAGNTATGAGKTATRAAANKSDAAGSGRAEIDALIAKHAKANGVPLGLAQAVVQIESRYNPRARGRAGEVGLMQIKPATARGMGYRGSVQGLYDPDTNLAWGMKYLAKARELGGGSICGTVLRYNAGHYAKRMNPTSSRYCAQVKTMIGKSGDEA